jgi:hypothetical protein
MNENKTEFGKICIEAFDRLTPDEERALLSGMTVTEIETARDLAKSLAWTARAVRPTFRR